MSKFGLVFDHVHLISEDPQGAASWYADKLGGKIVLSQEVRGAPQFHVAFDQVTIIVRGQRPGEQPDRKNNQFWGTDHFGFQVSGDFDRFCDDLKGKGVKFRIDPMDFTPGLRIAFLEGPDGVSLELLQRKG
jgi:lactoylglutathione lyase